MSMTQALDEEVRKMQEVENLDCVDWKHTNEAIGITVSYDMGWNKRSSGRTYNSLSGHGFFVGGYSKKIILSRVASKQCSTCDSAKKKGVQPREHACVLGIMMVYPRQWKWTLHYFLLRNLIGKKI